MLLFAFTMSYELTVILLIIFLIFWGISLVALITNTKIDRTSKILWFIAAMTTPVGLICLWVYQIYQLIKSRRIVGHES